jgi:hypothetical protein
VIGRINAAAHHTPLRRMSAWYFGSSAVSAPQTLQIFQTACHFLRSQAIGVAAALFYRCGIRGLRGPSKSAAPVALHGRLRV